mmetsp:Transcript_8998/g.23268  ORF Transcript_8998/g.23268 Transcript_8998/m.23268 type:complete len:295 (+) Transcript_8998:149-1033(+)
MAACFTSAGRYPSVLHMIAMKASLPKPVLFCGSMSAAIASHTDLDSNPDASNSLTSTVSSWFRSSLSNMPFHSRTRLSGAGGSRASGAPPTSSSLPFSRLILRSMSPVASVIILPNASRSLPDISGSRYSGGHTILKNSFLSIWPSPKVSCTWKTSRASCGSMSHARHRSYMVMYPLWLSSILLNFCSRASLSRSGRMGLRSFSWKVSSCPSSFSRCSSALTARNMSWTQLTKVLRCVGCALGTTMCMKSMKWTPLGFAWMPLSLPMEPMIFSASSGSMSSTSSSSSSMLMENF